MAATYHISLNGLRFFAEHGMFPEEKKVGNEFEINITLVLNAEENIVALEQTIDYAEVFSIVKEKFSGTRHLLETLTAEIAEAIYQRFPALAHIAISITKLAPPIMNFTGSVTVQFNKYYTDHRSD